MWCYFLSLLAQHTQSIYVTERSDRTHACLKSVLRLSVDKGQMWVYFKLRLTVTTLVLILN